MGNVVISPNIRKEKEYFDSNGNQIDPKTKQIIKPVEVEFVPPEKPKEETTNESILQ
jgi:hypothetical protein